jgi:hypothetical protein
MIALRMFFVLYFGSYSTHRDVSLENQKCRRLPSYKSEFYVTVHIFIILFVACLTALSVAQCAQHQVMG